MEILYVIAMFAIFTLCLALLFTARRILRSSPLSSGDLSLSPAYETEFPGESLVSAEDATPTTFRASVLTRLEAVLARPSKAERVDSEPILANWIPAPDRNTIRMTEPVYPAQDRGALDEATQDEATDPDADIHLSSTIGETAPAFVEAEILEPVAAAVSTEPPLAEDAVAWTTTESAEERAEETPAYPKKKPTRTRKPMPPRYAHALECLLLGISVVVLVGTQRSIVRNRSLHSSQHRVA